MADLPPCLRPLKQISSDVFGELWLAKYEPTNKLFALREVRPDLVTPAFADDLPNWVALKHPAIVSPHRLSRVAGGRAFLASKFVAGTVFAVPSTALAKMKLLFGVAEALRYLHERGILLPVCSSSILLDSVSEPHVIDPGLVKHLSPADRLDLTGFADDLSPESDVFAFGTFAFRVLTGSDPTDPLVFPPDVSPAYADLVHTCRHPLVSQRPTFAAIVREFLSGDLDLTESSEFRDYVARIVSPEFSTRLLIALLFRTNERPHAAFEVRKVINAPLEVCGIFEQLTRDVGGNVHELGIVRIDGNHYDEEEMYKIGGLVTRGWRSHWESKNEPNSWVQFDFRGTRKRMRLAKYEIQTWNSKIGHLRQWVLEASNDGAAWTEIDRRAVVTQLNHPSNRCCFKTKVTGEFVFIKLRQTGPNSSGMNILNLTGIEFYGDLV
jgi:serine/threonine protein kinase